MKFNETSFFVFIASIIIGVLISLNISFKNSPERVVLSAQQYQDAFSTRSKLYRDIAHLKQLYNENESKLYSYKNGNNSDSKILQEMVDELQRNSMILGDKEVQGEGLQFTINDASWDFDNSIDDGFSRWLRLVHNTDIMLFINELRNAGAEAIEINGQRVIGTSEVYCSGPFLSVNGVKFPAPFYVNAIGNKELIQNYMTNESGILNILKVRGIEIDVKPSDNVKIPSYVGNMRFQFMKEAVNPK